MNRHWQTTLLLGVVLWLTGLISPALAVAPAGCDAGPNLLFSEGAVLQRGQMVPIWGPAGEGERITVAVQGRKAAAICRDGRWRVDLPALEAGGPFKMTIAGQNKITLKNVWIGEVWVCSGQSNMDLTVADCDRAEQEIVGSAHAQIRLCKVPRQAADGLSWKVVGDRPDNEAHFITAPFTAGQSSQLLINLDGVTPDTPLTVELLDGRDGPVAGYWGADAAVINQNGIRHEIIWPKTQTATLPPGKQLAIKLKFPDNSQARLFALYVTQ